MSIEQGSSASAPPEPPPQQPPSPEPAPPAPGEVLFRKLESAQSWFELAELLAMFAWTHGSDRSAFVQNSEELLEAADASLEVRTIANTLVTPPEVGFHVPPDAGKVGAIRALLLQYGRTEAAMANAALEVAQAIGEKRSAWFEEDYFVVPGTPRRVEFGKAYPRLLRSPLTAVGRGFGFNTEPAKLPPGIGQVRGLRLAGQLAKWFDISVTSWMHDDPFAALGNHRPLVVATCHPNDTLEEFDAPYRVHEREKRGSFHTEGPLNRPRQRWLLRQQIADAVAAGASVVVIPEYGLHVRDRKPLKAYLDSLDIRRPLLVVGGTGRVRRIAGVGPVGDDSVAFSYNEAIVWAGPHEWSQDKLYPARITAPVPERTDPVAAAELVTPGQTIHVIRTPRWVVAVLICRDALQHEVVDLLAEMGVNLCLVASSSPHSGSIIGSLAPLRVRSQAFTVLVNTPPMWAGAPPALDAAFDGPFEHPPGPLAKMSSERALGPGVWIWRPTPQANGAQWHPTALANSTPEEWLHEFTRLVNAPRHNEDLEQTLAHLFAIHCYPGLSRLDSGEARIYYGRRALRAWLGGHPTFRPAQVAVAIHGLVAIVQFTWKSDSVDRTWTSVLTQQPDGHWLALFHDPNGPRARDARTEALLTAAKTWENEFVRLANSPRGGSTAASVKVDAEVVKTVVPELMGLYGKAPVYMHRPGRPTVGRRRLEQLMAALLKRGPEFALVPGGAAAYGPLVVQTCMWSLKKMGTGFPDESGRSTVVLLTGSDNTVQCIYDDPWSKLSGPLQLEPGLFDAPARGGLRPR